MRLPGQFFPDLMVQKAEAFIAAHKTGPFFLYFAANIPDDPGEMTNLAASHPGIVEHLKKLYESAAAE